MFSGLFSFIESGDDEEDIDLTEPDPEVAPAAVFARGVGSVDAVGVSSSSGRVACVSRVSDDDNSDLKEVCYSGVAMQYGRGVKSRLVSSGACSKCI